jgi:hypothetical protein
VRGEVVGADKTCLMCNPCPWPCLPSITIFAICLAVLYYRQTVVAVSWLCSDSGAITNFKSTQLTTSFTKPPDLGKPIYHRALISVCVTSTSDYFDGTTGQKKQQFTSNLRVCVDL